MNTKNAAIIAALLFANYGVGSDIGKTSDKYDIDPTPAGWTFAIWGLIYGLIILHVNKLDTKYLAATTALNIAWLYLFSKANKSANYLPYCAVVLATLCALNWKWCLQHKETASVIGIYAAWTTAATLLNGGLTYKYTYQRGEPTWVGPAFVAVVGSVLALKRKTLPVSVPATWLWASAGIYSAKKLTTEPMLTGAMSALALLTRLR